MSRLDRWFEDLTRQSARRVSRRNWLSRFGGVLVGGVTLPLLPVARAAEKHTMGEDGVKGREGDPTLCDRWLSV
jgi:methylamine dehydrogenase light chain